MIFICTTFRTFAEDLARLKGLKQSDWQHVTHQTQIRGFKNQVLWLIVGSRNTPSVDRLVYSARSRGFRIVHIDREGNEVEATKEFGAPSQRSIDRLSGKG